MRKIKLMVFTILMIGLASCRDTEKEQEELDATLDKIESVEEAIDETAKEVEEKAEDVKEALSQLDSI